MTNHVSSNLGESKMTSPDHEPIPSERQGKRKREPEVSRAGARRADAALLWTARILCLAGVIVSVAAAILTGSMLKHGQIAYATILVVVFVVSSVLGIRFWRQSPRAERFKPLRWMGVVAFTLVLAAVGWLVPSAAIEPSLLAMHSDARVTVNETSDQIVLAPAHSEKRLGLFFQPGARVDARAYVATLRPLAEEGFTVVIPKQPLGIAFLATGAFKGARTQHSPVDRWVVGGHSLGGTVSALDAQSFSGASTDPVVGLLLFASYPATDMSAVPVKVLSLSGSNDGLATVEKINNSKALLPADSTFTVIEGAVHADFGDYGAQAGDGQPGISRDTARANISTDSLAFMESLNSAD